MASKPVARDTFVARGAPEKPFSRAYARAIFAAFAFLGIAGVSSAEVATFYFAQVGNSYSAFLPADDPIVGQQIVSARIYLDLESFPGSDAANFFTDILFPIEPLPGNDNFLSLSGEELNWSGSGVFHHFEETARFNGTFISRRYGAETPGEGFSGQILDSSRIEFEYVPEPASLLSLALGTALFARRRPSKASSREAAIRGRPATQQIHL